MFCALYIHYCHHSIQAATRQQIPAGVVQAFSVTSTQKSGKPSFLLPKQVPGTQYSLATQSQEQS
jgi:hypothetical protein